MTVDVGGAAGGGAPDALVNDPDALADDPDALADRLPAPALSCRISGRQRRH